MSASGDGDTHGSSRTMAPPAPPLASSPIVRARAATCASISGIRIVAHPVDINTQRAQRAVCAKNPRFCIQNCSRGGLSARHARWLTLKPSNVAGGEERRIELQHSPLSIAPHNHDDTVPGGCRPTLPPAARQTRVPVPDVPGRRPPSPPAEHQLSNFCQATHASRRERGPRCRLPPCEDGRPSLRPPSPLNVDATAARTSDIRDTAPCPRPLQPHGRIRLSRRATNPGASCVGLSGQQLRLARSISGHHRRADRANAWPSRADRRRPTSPSRLVDQSVHR